MGKVCGIANYAVSICEEMDRLSDSPSICWVGGDIVTHDKALYCEPCLVVEHLQMEYQFWPYARLRAMAKQLHDRDIQMVVTMHTVTDNELSKPYNDAVRKNADKVLIHSPMSKMKLLEMGFALDQVEIVPMPIRRIEADRDVQKIPEGKTVLGFFGFLYRHKGVLELIAAFAEMKKKRDDLFLLLCASKPQNPHDDIEKEVVETLKNRDLKMNEDYLWVSKYLPDGKVLGYLEQCDAIALPYSHYGGYGTSAAVTTAACAGVPLLLPSDICWFNHVPPDAACFFDANIFDTEEFSSTLQETLDLALMEGRRQQTVDAMRRWMEDCSIEKAALRHLEIYEEITGKPFVPK